MRKLVFMLAFVLVGTFAFANVEIDKSNTTTEVKTEILENGDVIQYNIVVDEFDVCTVTVTIMYSDGTSSTATATDNTGDCDAAYWEAYALAGILTPK